jgi:uncharacterized protein (TIGR00251 family)
MILRVRVTPRAQTSRIRHWDGAVLHVHLHASPKDGEANEELIRVLAKAFRLPKTSLRLQAGHTSREKRVELPTIDLTRYAEGGSSTPPTAHG